MGHLTEHAYALSVFSAVFVHYVVTHGNNPWLLSHGLATELFFWAWLVCSILPVQYFSYTGWTAINKEEYSTFIIELFLCPVLACELPQPVLTGYSCLPSCLTFPTKPQVPWGLESSHAPTVATKSSQDPFNDCGDCVVRQWTVRIFWVGGKGKRCVLLMVWPWTTKLGYILWKKVLGGT